MNSNWPWKTLSIQPLNKTLPLTPATYFTVNGGITDGALLTIVTLGDTAYYSVILGTMNSLLGDISNNTITFSAE